MKVLWWVWICVVHSANLNFSIPFSSALDNITSDSASSSNVSEAKVEKVPNAGRSAGILYEVWHSTAAQAMKKVLQKGGRPLTVETVIRSNGTITLDEVYGPYGISADIYNVQPALGFYCLYRKRPNDTNPPLDDCDNITNTATAHANMLSLAGFDYVSVDITNWPQVNVPTDVAVLRPTEVLFEEWAALRQKGIKTPAISIWPCSPAGSNTWQYLLDNIYNKPEYDSLIYKDETGKKVVFVPYNPTCYDEATAQLIASNGGRNDIAIVKMWALFGQADFEKDVWGFFSPCIDPPGQFTTSMVGVPDCNQFASSSSGNVVEITASGSYMVSQCALPFAAPGHLRGLTVQRLFQKVLNSKPANMFFSSFNEHIGGRQAPASGSNIAFNMGLPNDPQRLSVWVDSYGSEFSRDIEPNVEAGSRIWDVTSSCVQLYKAGKTCADAPSSDCCTTTDKQIFTNVYSLVAPGEGDYLLTIDANERTALVGQGWKEACNPIPAPSAFCVDGSIADGRNGPFMMYNSPTAVPGAIALYRCFIGGKHFFSPASNCEGQKTESLMGYISPTRGGETLRALRRCITSAGLHTHALDLECDKADSPIYGFVR